MLSLAPSQAKRPTHTDELVDTRERLFFGDDSQMELAVSWSGRERSFRIVEFSTDELVVAGFRVEDLDLCHHEATVDFCDGELLDEVSCRVVFRGFARPGVARLRIVTGGRERAELVRFAAMLGERLEQGRVLAQVWFGAAASWS